MTKFYFSTFPKVFTCVSTFISLAVHTFMFYDTYSININNFNDFMKTMCYYYILAIEDRCVNCICRYYSKL